MEEMHSEASERDSYIHPQPFPSPMDLSELERQTYFQAAFRTPGQGPHDSIHTAYFVPHPDFKVATPMEYIRSPSPSNTVSSTDPSDTTFIESDNGCEEDFGGQYLSHFYCMYWSSFLNFRYSGTYIVSFPPSRLSASPRERDPTQSWLCFQGRTTNPRHW